jgi:single-strand DNA-binding protein
MINRFIGVGRLTADADLRYTSNGTPCLKFSLCINKSTKKGDKWEEKPNFFNCVVWGKYGEAMQKHMIRGKRIGIEGELNHNPWTDDRGVKHNDVTIVIDNISLLDSPRGGGENNKKNEKPDNNSGKPNEPPEDDIPF